MIKTIFDKQELKIFIISVLALSFAYGFDDKRPIFDITYYILNLLRIIIITSISLLIIQFTLKYIANKYYIKSSLDFWGIKRINFSKKGAFKRKIPLGVIFAVIGAFISKGAFAFALTQSNSLKENTTLRAIKKNKYITELETALIYSTIPLTAVFLICIGKIFAIQDLITINSYLAIFTILPLPSSDAIKILFSAKFYFLFIFIFIIMSTILLNFASIFASIFIAVLVAFIILIINLFKTYI